MTLIEWREAFETGIADVDDDHKELLNVINLYYEDLSATPSATAVLDFLGAIYARISAHFTLEETIMLDGNYDKYEEHRGEHEQLLAELRNLMADRDKQPGDLDDVARRLNQWFTNHFKTSDARFHACLHPR